MSEITLRRFTPEDTNWLVRQHGEHYAHAEGFDDSFGILVREILEAFVAEHDPARERGWIAMQAGQRLGSIFCVAAGDSTERVVQLYLDAAYQMLFHDGFFHGDLHPGNVLMLEDGRLAVRQVRPPGQRRGGPPARVQQAAQRVEGLAALPGPDPPAVREALCLRLDKGMTS